MKPSGKFVLRIPPDLHRRLQIEAQAKNISLNQTILNRLQSQNPEPTVVSNLRKAYGESLLGVILFGSAARGEMRNGSDLDLLIVIKENQPIQRSLYRIWDEKVSPDLTSPYSPQFTHLPNSEDASSLWLEVALEGEILFEVDLQIRNQLQKIKSKIASGEYQRKISHGHPYWTRHRSQIAK